jgi:glycosyltransferase involved in cell wall biosynthesis
MPDGRAWPRISIVTPSFNQGNYIEETIRSVLLQGYPDLELIITDGASTDKTLEVIKKYERWLSAWLSESDRGQTHAINKGMIRTTGDILAYLNSDDAYLPGALYKVATMADPARDQLLFGDVCLIEGMDWTTLRRLSKSQISIKDMLFGGTPLSQPASFWTKRLADKVGPFDESLHYAMDYDIMLRMIAAGAERVYLNSAVAVERRHELQKSSKKDLLYQEKARVRVAIARSLGMSRWWYLTRSLLYNRLRRPIRLYRFRKTTLQERYLISLSLTGKRASL